MASMDKLLILTCLVLMYLWSGHHQVYCQRNLLHWKRDLEYRINLHHNQRRIINDIVASSIYTPPQEALQGRADVVLRGHVRFTDLVIPEGSLIMDPLVARSTVRILHNKTLGYVNSKMNELDQIRGQLDTLERQMGPGQQFIDKGYYNMPHSNNFSFVQGTRIFKQFIHGHMIESQQVDVKQINFTNVDKVINDTYMDNMQFGVHDSKSRLLFEGKKTFKITVFQGPLRSGCCERLKPLHTDRMMIRSRSQDILAPVMFQTNDRIMREPVVIRRLSTNVIYNSQLAYGLINHPNHNGLLTSPPENHIQISNLINIRAPNQSEFFKTLVFRDVLMADDVNLDYTFPENRLLIGVDSNPRIRLDLASDNYLLKYPVSRNSTPIQRIFGTLVINSETLFMSGLRSSQVNGVHNFTNYIQDIVRIDRPANISGVVQFNALPSIFIPFGPARSIPNAQVVRASQNLNIGLLNGMRIPDDIFVFPPDQATQPLGYIRVRGPRHFIGRVWMDNHVKVEQLVNGMQMPDGVIPLHLNDFMSTVGASNLWFLDGIEARQIITESGQFDDITLRDAHNDAKSLIMNSMITNLPDGSRLIKAPMRITNLVIQGDATKHQGLLNGFNPQSIMELDPKKRSDTMYGKRTFEAPVEAHECILTDINHLANWTNQLIRIDRPNTIQTVHTKLAFVPTPMPGRSADPRKLSSSIHTDRFGVEFYPNTNPVHYTSNLNFSPELFILQQALLRGMDNQTGGRFRVMDQVRLLNPQQARINGVALDDIVTLDRPFRFADKFVMVGKVEVAGTIRAQHVASNYPIDTMDLVQFDKYRIPISGSRAPIRLNNLVLSTNNRATFVQCRLLNGISFNEFVNSIMSLTRPQVVDSNLVFTTPVNFEGLVRTESSLNGLKQFKQFTQNLKTASYTFEDGLQCNSVMLRN